MKKYSILAFLVVIAFVLAACGGSKAEPTPIPAVPADYAGKTSPAGADATVGAELFNTNCTSCHGPTGKGDGPAGEALDPKPRNLVEFTPLVGDNYLFWRINTGVEGTSMVAWSGVLTEEDIWNIIAFIRTLK